MHLHHNLRRGGLIAPFSAEKIEIGGPGPLVQAITFRAFGAEHRLWNAQWWAISIVAFAVKPRSWGRWLRRRRAARISAHQSCCWSPV